MYTKINKISSGKNNLSNYVEGYDVYNSKLMELLNDPSIERVAYTINTYEYRPDLIADDFYNDKTYLGILFLTCGTSYENYKKGTVLYLITKSDIDNILNNI